MKRNKKIFNYWLQYKQYFILIQIIELIQVGITSLIPYVNSKLIDEGIGGKNITLIVEMLSVFVVLGIMQCILSYAVSMMNMHYKYKCEKDLKVKVLNYFIWNNKERTTAEIDNILSNDISNFISLFSDNLLGSIFSIIKLIAYWVIMFCMSWKLSLINMVLVISLLIYNYINGKERKGESKETHDGYVRIIRVFNEIIRNVKELRMVGAADYSIKSYGKTLDLLNTKIKKMYRIGQKSSNFSQLHSLATECVFWGIGGYFIVEGSFSLGLLISFMGYSSYALSELSNIISLYGDYSTNHESIDSVLNVLDRIEEKNVLVENVVSKVDSIKFKNYSFRYDEKMEYLYKNVNVTFTSDKLNYLVGRSGIGKTTLIKCILGELDEYQGDIFLDGINIKNTALNDVLPEIISWVPQDAIIFSDSIYNNITLGKDYDKQWIIDNCKLCQIYDDILMMENGFDTIVGDNGIKLSGGQKQRIGLVRALVQNKPVLIMDEVTSSVDNQNSCMIRDNLHLISEDKLVIIITHNTEFIAEHSKIFTVENNNVIEGEAYV